jgi:phospholipase D1/2
MGRRLTSRDEGSKGSRTGLPSGERGPITLTAAEIAIPLEVLRRHDATLEEGRVRDYHFRLPPGSNDLEEWLTTLDGNGTDFDINFGSFAPERSNVRVKSYVDGKEYFAAVARAIEAAKQEIFIAGWMLSPEILLQRGEEAVTRRQDETFQLGSLLRQKADDGVRVYVLLWSETLDYGGAVNNTQTRDSLRELEADGRNHRGCIHVVLHTPALFWTHHQKILIVDQRLAFVGGMDLCFGRWDDSSHSLTDVGLRQRFQGKDYYNPRLKELTDLGHPFVDLIDRNRFPRMPWHDVQIGLTGGLAARDISWNFIQRWNHHVTQLGIVESYGLLAPEYDMDCEVDERYVEALMGPDPSPPACCVAQVLRSLAPQSGSDVLEQSIHTRYLDLISTSQHLVYIEQQFFITSLPGLTNEIGNALFERVSKAIANQETFRAIIVLPMHPSGSWNSGTVRSLLRWQSLTIAQHEQSLLHRLRVAFPNVSIEDYLSFYALINHGKIADAHFVEQVYVHSKLLIVDDRVLICGSANVNDRSMTGDRDSEIAVACTDTDLVESKMAGRPFMVTRFVHDLSIRLWAEHLGLGEIDTSTLLRDPVDEATFVRLWRHTAMCNQECLAPFLALTPGSLHDTVLNGGFKISPQREAIQVSDTIASPLLAPKGHIVPFPVDYRFDTELLFDVLMPKNLFQ